MTSLVLWVCAFVTGPCFAQTVEELKEQMEMMGKRHEHEREEMQRRIEQLERAAKPPHAPEPRVRVHIRKPEELRPYSLVVCPGFLECPPEPLLQLEVPKPATERGWELELQAYDRFRFNLYDNFPDTLSAAGSTVANRTVVNDFS